MDVGEIDEPAPQDHLCFKHPIHGQIRPRPMIGAPRPQTQSVYHFTNPPTPQVQT